jgi:hypothetical protein
MGQPITPVLSAKPWEGLAEPEKVVRGERRRREPWEEPGSFVGTCKRGDTL